MPRVQQTHVDILNLLFHAQAVGHALDITRDGRIKEASLGERLVRAYKIHKHGEEWALNKTAEISRAVGLKLQQAIERAHDGAQARTTATRLRNVFDQAAVIGELPSSGLILQTLIKGKGVRIDQVHQDEVGFKRRDISEVDLSQTRVWSETGRFPKNHGAFFQPGQIGDAGKVRPHVHALLRGPSGIKPHELDQTNRFLWDTSQMARGEGPNGQTLAQTLDKSKVYNFAVTVNADGHPVVVLGFEDQRDGSRRGFGRGTPKPSEPMGHPTLTQPYGQQAIFGGELMYIAEKGGWTINNNSGRYGKGDQEAMAELGIEVDDLLAFTADLMQQIHFPLACINRWTHA